MEFSELSVVSRIFSYSIEGCAWSPDGEHLALAGDDGALEVVARSDLTTEERYELSTSAVRSAAWIDDGAGLVVGAYDNSVYRIEREHGPAIRLVGERAWPRSITATDGHVAVGSFTSHPQLWGHQDEPDFIPRRGIAARGPNAVNVFDAGVAIGTDSGEVVLLRRDDLSLVRSFKICESPVLGLANHGPDIIGTTYSGRVFKVSSHGTLSLSEDLSAPLPSVCVVGEEVVTGTYGGELVSLDIATLKVLHRAPLHAGSIKSVIAFGECGVLTASTDYRVATSDCGGRGQRTLWQHGNLVNAVSCLGQKTRTPVVASASRDRTVRIGKIAPGGQAIRPRVLLGPDESIKTLAVLGSSEAPVVIAGSYDFGLYYWQVDLASEGEAAQTLGGERFDTFGQGVSAIAVSTPSEFVVAAWDRQIRRYQLVRGVPRLVAAARLEYEK